MTLLLLLLGLALVVFGGDLFVRASTGMAELLRVPRIIIGGTLMSLATTSPEIAVSVMSGLRGEPGLAVGNAIGSVMCNFGLIAGTLSVLTLIPIQRKEVLDAVIMLTVVGMVLLAMSLARTIFPWEGAVLVGLGIVYFAGDFVRSLINRTPAKEAEAAAVEELHHPTHTIGATVTLFIVGAVLVVGGSRLLVDNAILLASGLGISAMIIGATIVAVGTSLPEYVTAIVSVRKGVADLSVGNLIGANIANLTLVAGASSLFTPVQLSNSDLYLNFPSMFLVVLIMGYALLVRAQLGRTIGVVLLTLYAAYITLLVTLPQL